MAVVYSGEDAYKKAQRWGDDAKSALYEEALQMNVAFGLHDITQVLEPDRVEGFREVEDLHRQLFRSEQGIGVLATLQARREEFQDITGVEIIGEQIAALRLMGTLIEGAIPPSAILS